jgi:hypothetical protein
MSRNIGINAAAGDIIVFNSSAVPEALGDAGISSMRGTRSSWLNS